MSFCTHTLRIRPALLFNAGHCPLPTRPLRTSFPVLPRHKAAASPRYFFFFGKSKEDSGTPKNQVFGSARSSQEFYGPMSAAHLPFITVWTSSLSPNSQKVSRVVRELVNDKVGEEEGGVAFIEVEYDAPDVQAEDLGLTYGINAVPTMLTFDWRWQMPLNDARVTNEKDLMDVEFLREYIRQQARQGALERALGRKR
ncbi:hypothetical protein QBC42DRAFT_63420 [Cladorrhinum samala]|uniref:Thioredoxin domain-containing protein n=1 Tax=Cladorrhinum samala TaxID=585594 RepID=A0AAV9I522_9PEZI|nr:hypothetical protein QBC42DRAFT_63420 [Cladorrhinum samala]